MKNNLLWKENKKGKGHGKRIPKSKMLTLRLHRGDWFLDGRETRPTHLCMVSTGQGMHPGTKFKASCLFSLTPR